MAALPVTSSECFGALRHRHLLLLLEKQSLCRACGCELGSLTPTRTAPAYRTRFVVLGCSPRPATEFLGISTALPDASLNLKYSNTRLLTINASALAVGLHEMAAALATVKSTKRIPGGKRHSLPLEQERVLATSTVVSTLGRMPRCSPPVQYFWRILCSPPIQLPSPMNLLALPQGPVGVAGPHGLR